MPVLMRVLTIILSLPKTIWVNFRCLPIKQAIKFPLAIHYNTRFCARRGGVQLATTITPFMIRIGFHTVPVVERKRTVVDVFGVLAFKGTAHIGQGSRIIVREDAIVTLGDNFAISATSCINCYKSITIGENVQLSWDVLIMDSDSHTIYGLDGKRMNESKEIVLSDKIWVGCDCKILKGAFVPNNCVIGAGTIVSSSCLEPNSLIVGVPAKSVKQIKGFKI